MDVAVLGPGGVGGLLAGLLARAGNPVEVLAGDSTVEVIRGRGLRVESAMFGDFEVSVQASGVLSGPVDACLVTVKNTQLAEALARVPRSALGDALVVPFLNGIEHVDVLRGVYPPDSVAAATIRVGTARVAPGVIRHTTPFAAVEIAGTEANRERVERLAGALTAAGLEVRVRDDEAAMLWDKLTFLAPLALMTTHERDNAGAIRTRRRDETLAIVSEVVAVANAEGAATTAEAVMSRLDAVPATMESSMLHDQVAGLPLELEAIGGAVVRRAAAAGIAVPVTARIVAELQARDR
ncbi:MAG: putative 2-dehydropantoate 2-reductase [Candidatus Dormibacteria bacterium]